MSVIELIKRRYPLKCQPLFTPYFCIPHESSTHQHYTRHSWQIEFVQAKSENKITRKATRAFRGRYRSSSFIYWKFINKCGIRWCQCKKVINYKCNSNSVIVDDSETKSPLRDAGWLTRVGKMLDGYYNLVLWEVFVSRNKVDLPVPKLSLMETHVKSCFRDKKNKKSLRIFSGFFNL